MHSRVIYETGLSASLTRVCPREESNLHYKVRNLASYPLNDEDGVASKIPIDDSKIGGVFQATCR